VDGDDLIINGGKMWTTNGAQVSVMEQRLLRSDTAICTEYRYILRDVETVDV